ncbi:MAG: endonuclease [Sphaerochaetaceae bacterium]|nr:endonuclease [Sphaerochaetaceae bacterium]
MKFRFSIMTLNLWNTEKLDLRIDSIKEFFSIYKPDFLCIQELRKVTKNLLDNELIGYKRVDDPFVGWSDESNIYYNTELFSEVEHGRVDLNMPEENRGLFYLRAKVKELDRTVFISTAHLTHQGNADEINTSFSYRQKEAMLIANNLVKLVHEGECAIVCGDFNDPFHPVRIISEKTDFIEVFKSLHQESPITFCCSSLSDEYYLIESIDKIMHNRNLLPIMATSPRLALSKGVSDHYPVMAMFEIK